VRILGLIPARGGSIGIPGKNLAKCAGRPLLEWTALAALEAELDRVVLSTDCTATASAGQRLGVDVPFVRPARLAADTTPTVDVVRHALAELNTPRGCPFDGVLILQPTNPCRTAADIRGALAIFDHYGGRDAVVSLADVGELHPWRMGVIHQETNRVLWAGPIRGQAVPRQYLPTHYIRDGGIYLIPTEWSIGNRDLLLPPVCRPLVIEPPERSIRVDTPADLERAEAWLKKANPPQKPAKVPSTRRRRSSPKRKRPAKRND